MNKLLFGPQFSHPYNAGIESWPPVGSKALWCLGPGHDAPTVLREFRVSVSGDPEVPEGAAVPHSSCLPSSWFKSPHTVSRYLFSK